MESIKHFHSDFSLNAKLDHTSRRIWVTDYKAGDPAALHTFLVNLARQRGIEKIIMPVRTADADKLAGSGFKKEGAIPGYFNGADSHFLAAYTSKQRSISTSLSGERKILKEILSRSRGGQWHLPSGFTMRLARDEDSESMSHLFRRVFASYPSPVFDPEYLMQSMNTGNIFMVIYNGRRLTSVAAAEIQPENGRAELTNCATDPEFRGKGLNTLLLASLEKMCLSRDITCLYSLARASSYAMNLVFHRLGYVFGGTLINNCHIGGRYENMNVWVKPQKAV
ncbi:MAG: putative beta-lysine N-acetyltransferase [Bacillota bacterium]